MRYDARQRSHTKLHGRGETEPERYRYSGRGDKVKNQLCNNI